MKAISIIKIVFCVLILSCQKTPLEHNPDTSLSPYSAEAIGEVEPTYFIFSINTQDFSYTDSSAAFLNRIIDLHEQKKIPVDVYLTTWMATIYKEQYPALFNRIKTSPMVTACYHTRAPLPYRNGYNWAHMENMTVEQKTSLVINYETHRLNLTTGQPLLEPGGFQFLKDNLGYAPVAAAHAADPSSGDIPENVYKSMGAKVLIDHSKTVNLGDKKWGLVLRPEHYDLKLFEEAGTAPVEQIVDHAIQQARLAAGAKSPYFIGVKMHDNDFFAENSAWLTVYGKRKIPNWDITQKSKLLTPTQQSVQWDAYTGMLNYVSENRSKIKCISVRDLVDNSITDNHVNQEPKLYIAGTMHIETSPNKWPSEADSLLPLFSRLSMMGKKSDLSTMKWSIGPDIGWLQKEPKARKVLTALEGIGVSIDIHAHNANDRAKISQLLVSWGLHPTNVANGAIVTEIDLLRLPQTYGGTSWQCEYLMGINLNGNHLADADDSHAGLWKPKSSTEYLVHDPSKNIIIVGGYTRNIDDIEMLSGNLNASHPVSSAIVMIDPVTFKTPKESFDEATIKSWASRMALKPNVVWGNATQIAQAWKNAGGINSQQ